MKNNYCFVQALAHQYSTELLEGELERTRLNIVCFMETSLQPSSLPGSVKSSYSSFQGSVSSPNYRKQQTVGSPGFSRRRRWECSSVTWLVPPVSLYICGLFPFLPILLLIEVADVVIWMYLFCFCTVKFWYLCFLRWKTSIHL